MADISITAANVVAGDDADFYQGSAGATITAGQAVYLDDVTNQLLVGDANGSMDTAEVKGIALHNASLDQPLRVQTAGTITIGGTTVVSTVYGLSGSAGGIRPISNTSPDNPASGDYTTLIGVGSASNKLVLCIYPSHQVKA